MLRGCTAPAPPKASGSSASAPTSAAVECQRTAPSGHAGHRLAAQTLAVQPSSPVTIRSYSAARRSKVHGVQHRLDAGRSVPPQRRTPAPKPPAAPPPGSFIHGDTQPLPQKRRQNAAIPRPAAARRLHLRPSGAQRCMPRPAHHYSGLSMSHTATVRGTSSSAG